MTTPRSEVARRAGVLALQGSAAPHTQALARLGFDAVPVRQPHHLDGVTHLVIPGGESTTLHHLLTAFDVWDPIIERARAGSLAIFGTCAGAILVGAASNERPPRMELLDVDVERNAYGRQGESFRSDIELDTDVFGTSNDDDADSDDAPNHFHAVFIRAPKFRRIGEGVRTLATHEGEPVLVGRDAILAATFHPELTDDVRIHEFFMSLDPKPAPRATPVL